MESGSYCGRHEREKAREKRGPVLKEMITGCAITHHSTFLGKCDPGIQTRCYQSPLPPTLLSPKKNTRRRRAEHKDERQMEGHRWRDREVEGRFPKRTFSDTTDLHQLHAASALSSACSWCLDVDPGGPASNICLSELQVVESGIHSDWLKENDNLCPMEGESVTRVNQYEDTCTEAPALTST